MEVAENLKMAGLSVSLVEGMEISRVGLAEKFAKGTIRISLGKSEGWTIDTFMEKHDSQPYNPDIANVFYRAGYIEHWGRGIEKICDACKELVSDMPIFELRGHGLRVYFKALQSALIDQPKTLKQHDVGNDVGKDVGLADRILELIEAEPDITILGMSRKIGVTTRTVEREMRKLRESNHVVRVGGRKYGHWEVK